MFSAIITSNNHFVSFKSYLSLSEHRSPTSIILSELSEALLRLQISGMFLSSGTTLQYRNCNFCNFAHTPSMSSRPLFPLKFQDQPVVHIPNIISKFVKNQVLRRKYLPLPNVFSCNACSWLYNLETWILSLLLRIAFEWNLKQKAFL